MMAKHRSNGTRSTPSYHPSAPRRAPWPCSIVLGAPVAVVAAFVWLVKR